MKSKLGVKMRKQRGIPFRNSQAFQQFQSKNLIDEDQHLLKLPIPQKEMGIQMLKMMEEMEKSKKIFRERILQYRQSKYVQGTQGLQQQQQNALDDFEDDESYYDNEVYDIFNGIQDEDYEDDDDVDFIGMNLLIFHILVVMLVVITLFAEQGEDNNKNKELKRQFIAHHKFKHNQPQPTSKQYDQDKLEPLFHGDLFRACAYKLSLAVILLGCVLSLYLLYEYMQPQTQSRLKEHIAYEVVNHHGVDPSYFKSQIFTQHSYLDYPFQLYSFVDQQFAKFLASGSPKRETFFNEQFVPLLFVPGSGQETDKPASINHLDQKLQELVEYEIQKQNRLGKLTTRESQERNKLFKFYSLDFQEALSAFSIAVIEKETVALMRAILYISTSTQEKIILICNQIGGLSCLGALAALQDEHLAQISQVIFLNSPLSKHPIESHFAFINKYKTLYKSLSQRIDNLQSLRILSFCSEQHNSEIFQLNLPLKNSLFLKTSNLRDVFTDLPDNQPLSSQPFLNLLSKYFILDYYHQAFSDGGIDSINNFFTLFDQHYEDSFDKGKLAFSKTTLDKRCGRIIPTFEKTINTDLLQKGRRVKVKNVDGIKENQNKQETLIKYDNKKKSQDQETSNSLFNQSLLCVKIATSHIRASNLVYSLHTNLLSQDLKVFTFKQQKGILSKQIAVEITPKFSFFFGTVYLHQQVAPSQEIYIIFSTKNNTFLHKEYNTFYKQQTSSEQLFLSLTNFQSSGNTIPPFIRPTKDEWQSHKQVLRARFQDFEEIGMYRYCAFQGGYPNLTNKNGIKSEHDWNRRDFSLLLLRETLTGRVISTSFSYAERDCNFLNIKKLHKENTENELLFFRFISNSHQDNGILTHSNDIGAYARWIGTFLKPILLNSHASLCCVLLVIQIRHFQVNGQNKVPSQLSILLHKLPSIATFEVLSIFFNITFQQSLIGDDNNTISNSQQIFANSIFTAFIVSLAIISTYILIQVGFQIISLLSFVLCSLVKLLFFRLVPIKLLQTSPYFNFFNAHTLLMPLVFLTNSPFKWIAVFIIFWLLLGFAQANRSLSLNILHGFGYLVLINFILNSHNLQAAFIRLNSTTDQTKFRSLLAADEFTSDFFTIVCWLFILARVHNLVASSGPCLQFFFAALGLIISFHTFRSVAPTNEYLCNFSYLLMLLTLYNHSSKEQSPNIKPQQTQQLQ